MVDDESVLAGSKSAWMDVTRQVAVLDGTLIRMDARSLYVSERGYLHGEGLFETIRIDEGALPALDRHLARLAASCRVLGLPAPPQRRLVEEDFAQLRRLVGSDGLVRLTWTAGPAHGAGPDDRAELPTRLLTWRRASSAEPIALWPVAFRPGEHAAHKTIARWPYQRARVAARTAGCDDALLVDHDGCVLETTGANVVARWGDAWATPIADGRILPGIGRAAALAEEPRIAERAISLADLMCADDVWLVGSTYRCPRPVARIGERAFVPRPWPTPVDEQQARLNPFSPRTS